MLLKNYKLFHVQGVPPISPLNQQLSVCLLLFPSEAFPKISFSLNQDHFFSAFWQRLFSEKAGKPSRDKWQHSANSHEQTLSKSKQLDLSEGSKNAKPLTLLPTVNTFFMFKGHVWEEALKDCFLPLPEYKYSINFSQELLTSSSS